MSVNEADTKEIPEDQSDSTCASRPDSQCPDSQVSNSQFDEGPPRRLNCWEIIKCQREPGGAGALKHGVCPAASQTSLDGMNNGKNGGRLCWAVAGSFSVAGRNQGCNCMKNDSCLFCEFFQRVEQEEGAHFLLTPPQL